MAFQIGSSCYSDASQAAYASASSEVGRLVPIGLDTYVVDVLSVSQSSITYVFQAVNSSASFTKVASFQAPPCGFLDAADGLAIGWGIAAVWLVTAGILFLRRGINE